MAIEDAIGLRHEALVYSSDDEFMGTVVPHLRQGVEDDEAVIAVLTRGHWAAVGDALGALAAEVTFVDCDAQYLRPARTLAAYDALVRLAAGEAGTNVHVVAEMPPSQSPAEEDEWLTYEAIFNRALAHLPVSVLCLYDARVFSERVIDGVRRTHSSRFNDPGARTGCCEDPEYAATLLAPAPRAVTGLAPMEVDGDIGSFRERLAAAMLIRGVPAPGVISMLIAATEVMGNAWRHGGGPTAGREGLVHGRFVCEISDQGCGLEDPMAGYYPPLSDLSPGKGLWIARQLMFRVEVLASLPGVTATGTTVRLWL
jgi:anti-sigma regulatory factor (Ser/Thr protein kinase)